MQALNGDPAADGEKQEEKDRRFQQSEQTAQESVHDAEGRACLGKSAQAFIQQDSSEFDDHDKQHKGDRDRDPLRKRAPEQNGGRCPRTDRLDRGEGARDDPSRDEPDAKPGQDGRKICARDFRCDRGKKRLFVKAVC